MRKTWMVVTGLALAAAPLYAQAEPGPGDVVASLFQAMKAGDADAMRALMHPDVRLISTSVRDGAPAVQVIPVDNWLRSVGSSGRELDERIYDTRVQQDQGLASVWTRYDLFVDGAHSHCGVDHVLLVRTAEGWRIVELSDTRSTEGCRGA
ncbi:MAG TPA: nuclear transport factor 2 family protein [Longimicrobiales bacterium]|nr:nuclear transport factor 2 family protein [Longimicrobiales bacterium]